MNHLNSKAYKIAIIKNNNNNKNEKRNDIEFKFT